MVRTRIYVALTAAAAYELIYVSDLLHPLVDTATSQASYDILWFIGLLGWIAPFCLVGYLVIHDSKHPFVPNVPAEEPEPEFPGPQSDIPMPKDLPVDGQEAYKLGMKHGLLLAAKGGVSYSISATGSTSVDVGGLDVKVTGTAKIIPVEDGEEIVEVTE